MSPVSRIEHTHCEMFGGIEARCDTPFPPVYQQHPLKSRPGTKPFLPFLSLGMPTLLPLATVPRSPGPQGSILRGWSTAR